MIPYFLLAVDAFPLKTYIMKPYSRRDLTEEERIANYRFSRGRRIVENTFGILTNVFRVFHTPINLSPVKAEKVVLAAWALHNFLRLNCRESYNLPNTDSETHQESPSSALASCHNTASKNYSTEAKETRDELKRYFNTVGRVPWQDCQAYAFWEFV